MKKIREVNYIFYMTLLYMFSSLYIVLNNNEIYKLFDIKKLIKYDSLIIIVVGLGIIFLLVNYYRNTSQVLKTVIFKITLPIVVILLGLNYPNFGLDGIMYGLGIYLIIIYIFIYSNFYSKNNIDEYDNQKEIELYPSRKFLVEVLNRALENYSLIALDGTWGSGKTTFMNIFMRDNKEKYYYIPINVMLFENRNSLKTEFLNQLKGIFKEEGIFQGSLMDFDYYLDGVSNDWVKIVKKIVFSKSKSFKEANEKLKSEIGKIEKRIVVGVDNLERIYGESEPEWKQILGFIHELQELGIKIVVMANLEEMLTTKKETGEKDLSNHEYFDKFYEFKLKLNEVTTGEIIESIEIKKDTLERELLKEQFGELTKVMSSKYNIIKKDVIVLKDSMGVKKATELVMEEEKLLAKKRIKEEELNKKKSILFDLEKKYYSNTKNPRKIKKIIEDIKSKKKIEKIHNIDSKEYEELIFKTSVFQLFYFDYFYRFKNEKEGIFGDLNEEKDIFLDHIEDDFKNNIQAVNRLLYFEEKDKNVKDKIESLKEESEINIYDFENYIKAIEIYSQRLDEPDIKVTKKKYKIIQKNMVRLEKVEKEKIHKIIKENEENICRLNYLTYPNELGIFQNIKYKFNNEVIYMMYRELEGILEPRRVRSKNELRDMLKTINVYYYFEKESFIEKQEIFKDVSLNEIDELIKKIKSKEEIFKIRKEKEVSSIKKAENIIYDMVLNFLIIIKTNMEKIEVTIIEELKLENWKEYDFKGKEKLLNIVRNNFQSLKDTYKNKKNLISFDDIKNKSDLLKNIIEKEENQSLILELADLIRVIEYRLVEFEILEKVWKINLELDINKTKDLRENLLSFIKEKSKEERLRYMFNCQFLGEWRNKVKEIGIIEEEGRWVIKF